MRREIAKSWIIMQKIGTHWGCLHWPEGCERKPRTEKPKKGSASVHPLGHLWADVAMLGKGGKGGADKYNPPRIYLQPINNGRKCLNHCGYPVVLWLLASSLVHHGRLYMFSGDRGRVIWFASFEVDVCNQPGIANKRSAAAQSDCLRSGLQLLGGALSVAGIRFS